MSNPPCGFKHEWKYPLGFKERIMATSCLLMWLLPWLTDLKSWYSIEVSLLEQSIIMVVTGNLPCIIYLHIRSDKTIFSCKTFHINFFISPFNKLLTFPQRIMRENRFRDLPPKLNKDYNYITLTSTMHFQISKWDKNLEHLNIDLHRLQCYIAAIRGSHLPNPQTLLACVSRSTKQTLSRLNIFSVMSFHAVVSARDPNTEEEVKTRNKAKRSASSVGKLKSALLTSLRINDAASVKSIRDRYSGGKGSGGTPRVKRWEQWLYLQNLKMCTS